MPVRFLCPECRKLLGIGTRKVGSTVACPRCSAEIIVPTPEEAALTLALSRNRRGEPPEFDFSELVVYDEHPAGGSESGGYSNGHSGASRPTSVSIGQIALVIIVAMLAFALGYWVASGQRRVETQPVASAPSKRTVAVDGKVTYQPMPGQSAPDSGAVVIAVPDGSMGVQSQPIPVSGLAPVDLIPPKTTLQAIDSLGGVYARTNKQGQFSLMVPKEGKYQVLLLSRNAKRLKNAEPTRDDLAMLSRYFQPAPVLLGDQKYRLSIEDFSDGAIIIHNFGLSGK